MQGEALHHSMEHQQRIEGCLLGTAAGDALGLPAEGLTPARQRKLYPQMDRYQLLGGRGLISDDTEHAVLTLCALEASQGQPREFHNRMRRGLRRWCPWLTRSTPAPPPAA